MAEGKNTPYAHGEREHHRIYDAHVQRDLRMAEDPSELFISFPFFVIAPLALILVAGFGYVRGWSHSVPFLVGLYSSMFLDHRLHILFHRANRLTGVLGWFQEMHLIHHQTHRNNFFFVSGLPWDVLFRTARTRLYANNGGTPQSQDLLRTQHLDSLPVVVEVAEPVRLPN